MIMEKFIEHFENMAALERGAWIIGSLLLFWTMERGFPLFRFGYNKWRHAGVNLVLLLFVIIINSIFGLIIGWSTGEFDRLGWGLFHIWQPNLWVQLILTVLILDLVAQYFVHYLLHKVKWMWKLHMIHHSDTKVDATTGTRHHPGDFVVRESFSLTVVLLLGAPIAFYMFYRVMTIFFTYFTHANIALPRTLDSTLSWVFITPNMHKFHHHFERPWTDTNFGNVFSIWDRLFGTFVYGDPKAVRYGLDVLDDNTDENLGYQLKIPFDTSIKTDY